MGEFHTSNENYPIGYTVQLSMADSLHTARELRDEYIENGYNTHIVIVDDNGGDYKCYVRVSPRGSKQDTQELLEHLKSEFPDNPYVKDAFVTSMEDTKSLEMYRDDIISSLQYQENMGSLRMGLPEHEVLKMSCTFQQGEEEKIDTSEVGDGSEVGDSLYYVQVWSSPACGLSLEMVSAIQGEAKEIRSITVSDPSPLETNRNIHIGSTEQEVRGAYGDYEEPIPIEAAAKKVFVAGSIYGGLTFTFLDGKVEKIFLGGIDGC